ncbi:MAG TPA: 2-phosphosulfolactate phosphatase [Gemmatimonadales bacterium]|nr:2-phosphosulfolactate phosphatase [Gemmatimonadales bacterium]
MKLDVVFSPLGLLPGQATGRTIFVIDILRATTVMCAALHHGARAILPASSTEEALRLAQTIGGADVTLCGERGGRPIPGFALGNSPLEMTAAAVRGRTLVMTTTNGTPALLATQGAAAVYLAGAVNLAAAAAAARDVVDARGELLILCAGRERSFALDDAYAAGRLLAEVTGNSRKRAGMNDAAQASLDLVRRYGPAWDKPLRASRGGADLLALGYDADIVDAARQDAYPVLPAYHERRVTIAATPSSLL